MTAGRAGRAGIVTRVFRLGIPRSLPLPPAPQGLGDRWVAARRGRNRQGGRRSRASPPTCRGRPPAAAAPERQASRAPPLLPRFLPAGRGDHGDGRVGPTVAIPVSLRPRGPPAPSAAMPLGLKPTCSVCRTTSSSMWKKGAQGEILCNHCTGRGGAAGGAGAGAAGGAAGLAGGGGASGAGTGTAGGGGAPGGGGGHGGPGSGFPGPSAAASQQSNGGGGGGKQSKQEIHRRSARLRNTKYKSAPAAEKKVSTKGKGRRHIFKLKNPIKAPEAVSTIITAESIFHKGVYYQIGDVVSVIDEQDGKTYYAQIRGFIQDQYCEKSAALTWLIPTMASPKDQFDPASYIIEIDK
ncbi:GATA zinc finger domain-containing protein 1 isoform X3 [Notamacropus eugenii]|uniref:GATA zinc finger domain-containing protein 1 isoform X3 n=1 Tax=Notamacropus eugenii TaxID=9315 RepID=UPI003B68475F